MKIALGEGQGLDRSEVSGTDGIRIKNWSLTSCYGRETPGCATEGLGAASSGALKPVERQ